MRKQISVLMMLSLAAIVATAAAPAPAPPAARGEIREIYVSQDDLDRLEGVSEELDHVGLSAKTDADGDTIGMRIDHIDKGTIAERVGFKIGDVITQVNDVDIDGPMAVMMVYPDVTSNEKAKVKFLRDGQRMVFDIRPPKPAAPAPANKNAAAPKAPAAIKSKSN